MSKYEELQDAHQRLLERSEEVEDPKTILEDVLTYIEQIKAGAEFVPNARERNQLRANLRYWASFVYDQTSSYPNTTLRPANIPSVEADKQKGNRSLYIGIAAIGGIILIFSIINFYPIFSGNSVSEPTAAGIFPDTDAPPTIPAPTSPSQTATASPIEPSEAAVFSPTATASPTPTPTATRLIPLPTSKLTPTVDPFVIEILKTEVAFFSRPSPTGVFIPVTSGGFLAENKAYMTASLIPSVSPAENCGLRTLTVALDPIDLFSGLDLGALVQLSQGGKVVAAAQLPFQTGTVTFTLPNNSSDAAVLVQVDQPLFLFETVIAQFYADCSRNRLFLYYRPDIDKEYSQTISSDLQLSWRMSTWGPSPDDKSWIATLLLVARGGDGNYIYWASGDAANAQENGLLLDNRLLVSKEFCDPARLRLGVTSAGRTIQRDMVLQAPDCIEVLPTPTP